MTLQFLRMWKLKDREDPCYTSCICAIAQCVSDMAATHGANVLRNPGMRLLLGSVAHPDNAPLLMLSLTLLRQKKRHLSPTGTTGTKALPRLFACKSI